MGKGRGRRDEVLRQAAQVQQIAVLCVVVLAPLAFYTPALDTFGGPKLGVVVLGALACLVAGAVRAWRSSHVTVPVAPAVIAGTVFVVALALRGVASGAILRSALGAHGRWAGVLLYSACLLLFLAVLRRFDERSVRSLSAAVVVAGALVLLYRAAQALDVAPFNFAGAGGAPSTLGNPNFLAAFLGMVVPIALWVALDRARSAGWRCVSAAVLVTGLVALVVARSVQGPVVASVGLLVFALAWVRTRDGRQRAVGQMVWAGAVVAGVAGIVALVTLGGPVERLREAELWTVEERVSFWRAAASTFADDPVAGAGVGMFSDAFTEHRPQVHATERSSVHTTAVHNVPLGFFAEGGVLVGLPFVAFVVLVTIAVVRGLLAASGPRLLAIGAIGGAWLGWLAQLLISIDTPDLTVLGWVLTAAVLVVVAPPREMVVALGPGSTPTVARSALVTVASVTAIVAAGVLLQGTRADVVAGRARRLALQGDLPASVAGFEDAIAIRSEEPAYPYGLGLVLRGTDQPAAALDAFERAAALHPGDARYPRAAADAAERAQDQEALERWTARMVEIDPRNPEALDKAAAAQLAAGRAEDAVVLLERAVELRPDSPLLTAMGEAKLASGDQAGARAALERALELDADNQAAKAALART